MWRERAEPGGGILFDLGPHLVDQAVVLFGLPDAVTGDVRIERDDAVVDDAFDVTLHYPRLRVLLRASVLASAPGPRFVVQGTAGSYVKYHLDPQEARLAGAETGGRRLLGPGTARTLGHADARDRTRARSPRRCRPRRATIACSTPTCATPFAARPRWRSRPNRRWT